MIGLRGTIGIACVLKYILSVLLLGQTALADPVQDVVDVAQTAFDDMPQVVRVGQIAGNCGADEAVNPVVAYCTSLNQIFLVKDVEVSAMTAYEVAHLYGHAVQVQHGVADFALGQIRQRPAEEDMLRGLVTRQVECIAGFFMARAGLGTFDLNRAFAEEPFTHSHWGRDPLRIGPKVSIGLAARAEWFAIGLQGNIAVCAPGEFTSDLLVAALSP